MAFDATWTDPGYAAPVVTNFFIIGDSKSGYPGNSWPYLLTDSTMQGSFAFSDQAVSGTAAAYWASNIAAVLAAETVTADIALVNIGTNDLGVSEAAWIANMETVIDAINAKWPGALVYLHRPWKRGFNAEADTRAGSIATLVAANAFARSGPDERTWFKWLDDGQTYSNDGIHYNNAGQFIAAREWKTSLGY